MTFEFEQKNECTCMIDGTIHKYDMASDKKDGYKDMPVGKRLKLLGKGHVHTVNGVNQNAEGRKIYFFKFKK